MSERRRVRKLIKAKRKLDPRFVFRAGKPYLHLNLGPEPVLITSKRQLREECKKRGVIDTRFDDGGLGRDG